MSINQVKTINLALQGGGSHGAFTWGVLDRLLEEDDRLQIEGLSGTSGGALNAALFLQGFAQGGASGARKALDAFWARLGTLGVFGFAQRSLMDQWTGNWNIDSSPASMMMDMMGRWLSPYQMNPLDINPFRDLLVEFIDVDLIRKSTQFKLFVAATNVETGRVRVFTREELSLDVLMATACLPFSYKAVMIDGVPYWDGGYTGNPAIFPLIYQCNAPDIAIVQLIPFTRKGTPQSTTEIINRLDEISFNASLFSEMRAISLVQRLLGDQALKSDKQHYKDMHLHVIQDEDKIASFGATSKINASPDFLSHLKELGRETADTWLKQHWGDLGTRSSFDVDSVLAVRSAGGD